MITFFGMLTAVAIVGIVFVFVSEIVKSALRHHERIERIRHGYPVDGIEPGKKKKDEDRYIDFTVSKDAEDRQN